MCTLHSPPLLSSQVCQGFEKLEEPDRFAEAERGLRAALYHLKQLSQAWRDVLSCGIARRTMGTLLDAVVASTLDCVGALPLATTGGGAGGGGGAQRQQSQREQLHFLLGLVAGQGPGNVFHDDLLRGSSADALAERHVPSWQRLLLTVEVLAARTVDDLGRRFQGEGAPGARLLRNATDVKALAGIVQSSFPDSPGRTAFLQDLA